MHADLKYTLPVLVSRFTDAVLIADTIFGSQFPVSGFRFSVSNFPVYGFRFSVFGVQVSVVEIRGFVSSLELKS